jgi:hypothetical protein
MKFMFSGTMLRFVEYAREIEVPEPNLEQALQTLLTRVPALASVLVDGQKNIRRTHQMFLNGESIDSRYYGDAEARTTLPMQPGDSVYFLTAIAGG